MTRWLLIAAWLLVQLAALVAVGVLVGFPQDYGGDWVYSCVFTLFVVSCGGAALGAVVSSGPRRVFLVSALLAGGGYWMLTQTSWLSDKIGQDLPTTKALLYTRIYFVPRVPPPGGWGQLYHPSRPEMLPKHLARFVPNPRQAQIYFQPTGQICFAWFFALSCGLLGQAIGGFWKWKAPPIASRPAPPRFRLLHLFVLVALASIACGALARPNVWWHGAVAILTIVAMLCLLIHSAVRPGRKRALTFGCLFFACAYLVLVFVPWCRLPVGRHLLTTKLLISLEAMGHDSNSIPLVPRRVVAVPSGEEVDLDDFHDAWVVRRCMESSVYPSASATNIFTFHSTGQWICSWIAGGLGAWLASAMYRRRPADWNTEVKATGDVTP